MTQVNLAALRNVQRLIVRLNAEANLAATLRAVVDGVVEGLGFGVAVVSLVHDDRTVEVVTVAGPQDVSDTLLGKRNPLEKWERAFARSHPWGALRFEPHDARRPRRPAELGSRPPHPRKTPTPGTPSTRSTHRCTPSPASWSASCPSTCRRTAASPASCSGRCWRCTPRRPASPSTTPACRSGCGPARSPSGSRSRTRRSACPSSTSRRAPPVGSCGSTRRCAGCWATAGGSCRSAASPTSPTPTTGRRTTR